MKLKLALMVAFGLAVSWGLSNAFDDDDVSRGNISIHNRLWVDHLPKDQRDITVQLGLVSKGGKRMGAVGATSAWMLQLHRVRWKATAKKLTLEFPQFESKTVIPYRTFRCKGEAPKPFDLCLELTVEDKTLMLYSRSGRPWKRSTLEDLAGEELSDFDSSAWPEITPQFLR